MAKVNYTCPTCGRRGLNLIDARRMLAAGYTYAEIGKKYGIGRQGVYAALRAAEAEPETETETENRPDIGQEPEN